MRFPALSAETQAKFIYKHAHWVVLALVCCVLAALPFASRLSLKANLIDLLPEDLESVSHLYELTSEVGGTSFLVAVIESKDSETAKETARLLAERAAELETVDYVDNRTGVKALRERALLFLSLESLKKLDKDVRNLIGYHRRKNNPFFIDLIEEEEPVIRADSYELEKKIYRIGGFSGREQDTFMQVILIRPFHPVSDFEVSEKLFAGIRGIFEQVRTGFDHEVTLGIAGPYKTRYDEYTTILKDIKRTGLITLIGVTLLMVIFFGNLRSVLFAYLSLSAALLFTAAYAALAIGYLNLITAFLLSILFGLGIDFAIHFLSRFEDVYSEQGDLEGAITHTYAEIGEPLLTSALTTGIAFFSLTVSQFNGFRHFGMIAGVGILLCFAVIFYGLPSLIVVGEKIKRGRWKPRFGKARWVEPKAGPIAVVLLVGLLFTGYSVKSFSDIGFEFNFANLQEKGATSIKLAERVGEHFGVVLNPVAIMTPNRAAAQALEAKINAYAAAHPETNIDFAASLVSHVPDNQDKKIAILKRIDERLVKREALINELDEASRDKIDQLREKLNPAPMTLEDLPSGLRGQYEHDPEGISVVYIYPLSSLLDGQMAKRFVRELRSLDLPPEATLAGEPVIYADILMLLEKDTPFAMMISLGIVILLLFLHFRRLHDVLWVLAPVFIGFIWMCGMAALTHFKFNYLNCTILPSILGVGIDSGIHIFHRYKREKKSTLYEIMRKTGKAVIMSLATTMAAFGSVYMALHRGMSSLGHLGLIGFLACLLAAVVFVPSLIEFFELQHWKIFKRAKKNG